MEKYLNPQLSPAERAEDLLTRLSLEEKLAQIRGVLPFPFPGDKSGEWIQSHGIGQVSALAIQMMPTEAADALLQLKNVQQKVIQESPHHIPAAIHMEGLCGAFIHGSANYPSGVNRGAAFDPELEEQIGKNVARDELAVGITQVLAPVLDISRDPRMGRCGESYGEDPALASALGSAYARGIQSVEEAGRRASATAKHFVGFHTSRGGIHGGGSSIGPRELREVYARSFQAAISEAGLKGVMPCYNVIDGVPFSASRAFLTGLLRDEMGFDGVAVSDYSAVSQVYDVKKVGGSLGEAGAMCLKAGMDVELPMPAGYGEELAQLFRDGKIPEAVLDVAVRRILTEKFRMGLFEHPFGSLEDLEKALAQEKASGVARKAAEESIVLLKNDGVLPITGTDRPLRVALIGPHADNARFYFGGYTHLSMMESTAASRNSLAGVEATERMDATVHEYPGTNVQVDDSPAFRKLLTWVAPDCLSLREELEARFPHWNVRWATGYPIIGEDESGFAEALAAAEDADLIIMTLGGKFGTGSIATMGEGIDTVDINLPKAQDRLIAKMKELNKTLIGIHFGGRPVSSDVADRDLDALLEAFCPAAYAAPVLADILTGALNPSGKLPVSVAYNAGQIPVVYSHEHGSGTHQAESIGFPDYVDCPHHSRYPFGYGLSYTCFEYENLTVSDREVSPDGLVDISFDVRNTGEVAGTEIVQLYLSDEYASIVRPVLELAGFARVALRPGEKKRVSFAIHPSQMAFLDEEMRWKIEKGTFLVQAGGSSEDIRLTDRFTVTEDRWIEGRDRAFYALGIH